MVQKTIKQFCEKGLNCARRQCNLAAITAALPWLPGVSTLQRHLPRSGPQAGAVTNRIFSIRRPENHPLGMALGPVSIAVSIHRFGAPQDQIPTRPQCICHSI